MRGLPNCPRPDLPLRDDARSTGFDSDYPAQNRSLHDCPQPSLVSRQQQPRKCPSTRLLHRLPPGVSIRSLPCPTYTHQKTAPTHPTQNRPNRFRSGRSFVGAASNTVRSKIRSPFQVAQDGRHPWLELRQIPFVSHSGTASPLSALASPRATEPKTRTLEAP